MRVLCYINEYYGQFSIYAINVPVTIQGRLSLPFISKIIQNYVKKLKETWFSYLSYESIRDIETISKSFDFDLQCETKETLII